VEQSVIGYFWNSPLYSVPSREGNSVLMRCSWLFVYRSINCYG